MSEMTIVETQRQLVGVVVIQSLDVNITTIGIEMVVVPTMDIVKRGVLIRFVAKLGNGLNGVSTGRKLNGSTIVPTITIGVVGTL
jgi:hypothetical protein